MTTTPDPYGRSTYHGKPLDNATISAVKAMEADLGYELTITQGIGGAAASAGAHLEGRAVDLAPFDWRRKLRVGLRHGLIGWHRSFVPGLWPEHVHMVLVLGKVSNARGIAGVAFRQIASYMSRRDGLKSNARDSSTHPELLVPFVYPPEVPPVPVFRNNITEARDLFVEAAHNLGLGAVKLTEARDAKGNPRKVARAQATVALALRRGVNGMLRILPKR